MPAHKSRQKSRSPESGDAPSKTESVDPSSRLLTCAEDNPWTPVVPDDQGDDDDLLARIRAANPSKDSLRLNLKAFARSEGDPPSEGDGSTVGWLDASEYARMKKTRRMSFHAAGCTGDPTVHAPQAAVADAMIADLRSPDSPAFFFHLGDIVYKEKSDERIEDDDGPLSGGELLRMYYANEFYGAYRGYERPIFAIPGNHDGKYKIGSDGAIHRKKSPMWHFLRNFCSERPETSLTNADGTGDPSRSTMTQPYPFFLLETPAAFIIGLYANVCNGGALDLAAPGFPGATQFDWLSARLKEIRSERAEKGRALIVATHYPPFSGAASFAVRGDPQSPKTPEPRPALPLANVLLAAFESADVWPDLVLSAHAHHYQRLTFAASSSSAEEPRVREIPFVICGCGGHGPVEYLWRDCSGESVPERMPPFDAILPPGCALSLDRSVRLVAYNDQDFGFLKVTIDVKRRTLTGEFRVAFASEAALRPGRVRRDSFRAGLDDHRVASLP